MKRKKSKGFKKVNGRLVHYGTYQDYRRDLDNRLREECRQLNPNDPTSAICCYHCTRCGIFGNYYGDHDCHVCNTFDCRGG